MEFYSLNMPDCEHAIKEFQDHWSNLRNQAINQDITVISILITIMLLLHCIAYNK